MEYMRRLADAEGLCIDYTISLARISLKFVFDLVFSQMIFQ